MKLIKELSEDVETEVEVITEASGQTEKNYYIKGVFMQAEQKNRNGRMYPKHILENALNSYSKNVSEKRAGAMGELGHPETPTLNLERVSHLITDLQFEGNNIIGRAKLLGTPYGEIAKKFVNEGITLGVSSRGLGSLKNINGINQVQEDFRLSTVDIVADPSAPDAFVQGILENKSWIFENGVWKEVDLENAKRQIRQVSKRDIERTTIKIFEDFLKKL